MALAECCFDTGGIGAGASIDAVTVARDAGVNRAAALYGESASRIIVSAAEERVAAILERAAAAGVPARVIGRTGGQSVRIAVGGETAIDIPIEEAERAWSAAIERYFTKRVA